MHMYIHMYIVWHKQNVYINIDMYMYVFYSIYTQINSKFSAYKCNFTNVCFTVKFQSLVLILIGLHVCGLLGDSYTLMVN